MHRAIASIVLATIFTMFAGCETGDGLPDRTGELATTETEVADLSQVAPPGKLPAGTRPVAYRLNLVLDPRRDEFSGEVAIDVLLDAPTDRIWLHGRNLDVSRVTISTQSGAVLSGSYEQVLATGVSVIQLDEELPAGNVTLHLDYSARFDRNLAGLFKVEEQGDAYVLAKSESIQARSFLPCFDEPGLKATFDITLAIPSTHEAIGNSPVLARHPVDDDLQQLSFATTPPMSTYLLSLAVGPFDVVERKPIPPNDIRSHPIPLRGVARKGRGGDMDYVLDITPRMVEIFEQELQQPYPFQKLDIIAAPQWPSGATELSAAITYREQIILVGDNPAPGARLGLLGIHAHEIAHMWFGNLVTPPWWDDLWLKEGFATWATPLVLTILEPDGGHDLNAAQRLLGAMQLDSLASTRAVREPIADNDEIRNAYDAITYSKSLGIINMVDRYFGPDTFRPALGRYVESFSDGVAESSDFYRVIGEQTKTPALTETFRGFIEQTGVPLVEADLDCDTGDKPSLTIRQSRYKALGSTIDDSGKTWSIPVCVRSNNGSQCAMITDAEQTLPLHDEDCPQWVSPNASGGGYYRWTLDGPGWAALTRNFDLLTPVEAMSAVDSAFASFEAGMIDASILLDIVAASSRARARQVITAALPFLQKYVRQYLSTAEQEKFLEFARDLYHPVIARSAGSTNEDAQLLHSQLISFMALTARDPGSRDRLRGMAHSFTGYGRSRKVDAMPSDLYYPALAVAIEDSGADFLPHLIGFRNELDDPLFESASANAIGHVSNMDQLGTVHELAMGEQLGPRETFGLLHVALSRSTLRDQHWKWLREYFPALVDKVPAQWRRSMPGMAADFCDEARRGELDDLFEEHGELVAGYQRSLRQTDERIGLCIALEDQVTKLADAMSTL